MSDPIERVRALLESAFVPLEPGETPEAKLAAYEAALATELAALEGCGTDELARLDAIRIEMCARRDALPKDVRARHSEWLRIENQQYKIVRGPDGEWRMPDLPAGVLSVPYEVLHAFIGAFIELEYRHHRRTHPSACDCAALAELKICREPQTPSLVSKGEMIHNFDPGEVFECAACGAAWFRGATPDDHGWWYWERLDAPGS